MVLPLVSHMISPGLNHLGDWAAWRFAGLMTPAPVKTPAAQTPELHAWLRKARCQDSA